MISSPLAPISIHSEQGCLLEYGISGITDVAPTPSRGVTIESPILMEIMMSERRKALAEAILRVLRLRLGFIPAEVTEVLRGIEDEETLKVLVDLAVTCPDLESFRAGLTS